MSGDVQPRKRKDKKKKKDDLGIEEPRGTAAALGDGDVFMHSQHDHGTGGHWCAKIIFFSLLAVLITLIGLIILENRGLTELEANSVESRYSGVLEGWLEDAPDDDHHDEHTLELKHPDDDGIEEHIETDQEDLEDEEHDLDDEHEDEHEDEDDDHEDDEDEHDDEDEDVDHEDDEDEHEDDDDEQNDDDDENTESNEDEVDDHEYNEHDDSNENKDNLEDSEEEMVAYKQYNIVEETYNNDDDDNDDDKASQENEEYGDNLSKEEDDNDDQQEDKSVEEDGQDNEDEENDINDDDDDDDKTFEEEDGADDNTAEELNEQDDDDLEEENEEIERIEREVIDTTEDSVEILVKPSSLEENADGSEETSGDEPPVERISTPPPGRPFVEIEEESIEKPIDTLAEEAEYERKQEELRREEAQASHNVPETEESPGEEPPSLSDRRMTLVSDVRASVPREREPPPPPRPEIEEEVFKKPAPVVKSTPVMKRAVEEDVSASVVKKVPDVKDDEEKELYSDEEEIEEEEEEEEIIQPIKVTPQQKSPLTDSKQEHEESEPEEVADDVEIIDDEQIEEEEEEEDEDEEEISDVDDTELLSRLEAKYGRLPEPERPGKHKEGGNSIEEEEWPGEPSDPYWREQLDLAEEELNQGSWAAGARRAAAAALGGSARARWLAARALDGAAHLRRDNALLARAVAAYLHLLKMSDGLADRRLLEVARRAVDRINFAGTYLKAEPVYRLLIRRFPENIEYRNNLTVTFLMANRPDLADEVLEETLRLWPNDRVALAHRGFVLKTHRDRPEEAVEYLRRALEGDAGAADEARFHYHLGDALLRLGRADEARRVHERGARRGHFPSAAQRSLYNVARLRARPWWRVRDTPYAALAAALERSWRAILREGEAAAAAYELEREGLLARGAWSQLELFARGRELPGRCARAPAACAAVRAEPAAARCRRGQVKFSALRAGTHVRAHVGPTNCRLRMHLGLSNTAGAYIRVRDEIRQWQEGKVFIFDDSFEHEVWHNGTGTRLVLIVDVWHPDLTPEERRTLPAI